MTAHVVSPQWAARVVSPLHDVLSESERRAILADNPDSYLHVTSDPLALPEPPGDVGAESVQAKALRRLLDLGAYTPVPEPALFVYRLTDRGREHTGVIASVAVEGFGDGRVLGHEDVQPERVAGLVRHYQHVPMRSELVALFHPVDPVVAELTARVVAAAAPGLHRRQRRHAVGVAGRARRGGGSDPTAGRPAAVRRRRPPPRGGGHPLWERRPAGDGAVLCALYPQDEVVLHAFHRRVRGPVACRRSSRGSPHFDVCPRRAQPGPGVAPGAIGLYAAGRWYVLRPREPRRPPGWPAST